jgi:hypothetical protein
MAKRQTATAVAVRVACAIGFAGVAVYALSKGDGFWNIVYGVGGAIAALGSLFMAVVILWAARLDDDPSSADER